MRYGVVAFPVFDGSAVLMIAALMCATLQVGCAWRTSTAPPALCGEACEVPETVAAPFPVPLPVDTIDTPGAVTSGFRKLSPVRGPPEVKLANAGKPGLASALGVIVPVFPLA